MSETALRYAISDEGLENVSVRAIAAKADIVGGTSDIEGIIQFNRKASKYEITSAGVSSELDTSAAQRILRNTISGAVADPLSEAAQNIRDLGINYIQNSQIDEINRLTKLGIKKESALNKTKVLNSIGKTYETFATSIDIGTAVDIARGRQTKVSTFGVGAERFETISDYNTAMNKLVESRAAMGNPFYRLSMPSIKASTIMAESSNATAAAILQDLNQLVASGKYAEDSPQLAKFRSQIDSMKYVDNIDLLSEVGVSHFKGQKEFRIFGGVPAETTISRTAGPSLAAPNIREKMFVPLEVLDEASKGDLSAGRVSLSWAEVGEKNYMNAVYKISEATREESLKRAEILAEGIVKAAEEKNKLIKASSSVDDKATQEVIRIASESSDASRRALIVKQMAENIVDKGIVIGSIEGTDAKRAFESLRAIGIDLSNDIAAGRLSGRIIDILGEGDALRVTPMIDEIVERATGMGGDLDSARNTVISYLNNLAEFISSEGIESAARTKMRRAKLGVGANKALDFYIKNKTKIGMGGLGLVAAGAAYYVSKKYRENRLYDETIRAQPAQQVNQGQGISDQFDLQGAISSFRRDPLVTAGVVGNLDRNKIGHHRMGNDKYSHLYSGV